MAKDERERRNYVAPQLQEVEWELPPRIELHTRGVDLEELTREVSGLPLSAQLALLRVMAPPLLKRADAQTRDAILEMINPEIPDLH